MNKFLSITCVALILVLLACSPAGDGSSSAPTARPQEIVTLSADLTELITDFNDMSDKLRLVFIGGPACGVCLRGMDDLNHSIIASLQSDARVHTLMIEVPALDSTIEHASEAIQLMPGPRVTHYWDEVGTSGLKFQEALDIRMYAWDVWMIYEPGATWDADSPPPPAYWEHQLPSLPAEQKLDADRFASEVKSRLAGIPERSEEAAVATTAPSGDGLFKVMQPRNYMVRQNHSSRGGYRKLKSLEAVRFSGETVVGEQSYLLVVETRRPDEYRREVRDGASVGSAVWDGSDLTFQGENAGLPEPYLEEYLASYDFDGWMTDWKDKGHRLWRLGMKKDGHRLPWVMEVEHVNGSTWLLHVDSHSGDIYRHIQVDGEGNEYIKVEFADFRDVDGFRFPFEVRYFESGSLLATDRFRVADTEMKDEYHDAGS